MKSAFRMTEPVVDTGKVDTKSALRLIELGDALRETKNSFGNKPDNSQQPNTQL